MMVFNNTNVFISFIILFATVTFDLQAQRYHLYVAAESEDEVYLTTYDANLGTGTVTDTIAVGIYPTEIEGPHGINVGLDGKYWYLSVAHGNPYGSLYKFKTGSNKLVARTELGMFPASLEISRATGLLYVVNFNLHGDLEPSTVSVVDPEAMTVVREIPTGIMPHGSRMTDGGKFQYHVSMMTDELMQLNTTGMHLSQRFNLADDAAERSMRTSSQRKRAAAASNSVCKPTWADPYPGKELVYVACNGSDVILEVDTENWKIARRFQTDQGEAPYNLEVSHDGKLLVVSYKGKGATGIWDLDSGTEIAEIENSRNVTHGVSISSDNKLAFISVEGIGGEPGSVDVIDLENLNRAAVIEVGKQAGGIIFWKMDS